MTLCALPLSLPPPSRVSIAFLGKMSQCFGHAKRSCWNGRFRTRSNFHAFQPVMCDGERLTAWTPRGGQGVHSLCTKYRFCTKSVYFTCQPPRPLLSLRADGDNETLTNPCILPLIWSSSDESRCFSFVLTTLPDLNFITNCGYHLSSFPLVIWLFYTVQRKCLVG